MKRENMRPEMKDLAECGDRLTVGRKGKGKIEGD